jgi:prepilin-type processing-associated H-X9-DG protein
MGMSGTGADLANCPNAGAFGAGASNHIGRARIADLPTQAPTSSNGFRMAWVGRNHGTGSWKSAKTNFAYVDGHVETKLIDDTLNNKFEWGEQVYSLSPGGDLVTPYP